ncbi:MAG: NRAMP family divalent metal transporter, partial [Acidimicrobiales bacterium]
MRLSPGHRRRRRRFVVAGMLAVWGPGLVVMLADTDAGSMITAAQSGSQFGYRMILPQLILIPILYVVQEMTVRLGILTGKGHGGLIKERFGQRWALISAVTLFAAGTGALLTEFAGVAGVGEMFGIPRAITVPVVAAFLIGVAMTGRYRRTERIAIAIGLAELVFIPAVVMAHPNLHAIAHGLGQLPLGNRSYVVLLAANVGAVIMPWMIFYQQGAVVERGLRVEDIPSERRDTAVGAILTQLIMLMAVLAFAATVGLHHPGAVLNTLQQMSSALVPFVGQTGGRILLAVAVLGASLVAALVASLAGAWGISEVLGWSHTLNEGVNR